jgi:hypothetical protein
LQAGCITLGFAKQTGKAKYWHCANVSRETITINTSKPLNFILLDESSSIEILTSNQLKQLILGGESFPLKCSGCQT